MLIALSLFILAWFTGGGVGYLPAHFNDSVKAEISDKGQRKSIEQIAEQVEKDVAAYQKTLKQSSKEALKLNADYKAKRNDFMKMGDRMIANRQQLRKGLLDQRFAMIELMTEAQWDAIWTPKSSE